MSNHYIPQATAHYGYGQPQGPPSPPMDDTSKCSLPSISNLLGLADGGSPVSETSSQASQLGKNFTGLNFFVVYTQLTYYTVSPQKCDTRPNSSHYNNASVRYGALPPTPPMSSDASFDGYHSPSTKSVSHLPAQNYYFDSPPSMSPIEPETHRHQMISRIPVQPTYATPAFASSYISSPAMASYYPTMQPTPPPQPQVSGLFYQRPLPQVSFYYYCFFFCPKEKSSNIYFRLSLLCH